MFQNQGPFREFSLRSSMFDLWYLGIHHLGCCKSNFGSNEFSNKNQEKELFEQNLQLKDSSKPTWTLKYWILSWVHKMKTSPAVRRNFSQKRKNIFSITSISWKYPNTIRTQTLNMVVIAVLCFLTFYTACNSNLKVLQHLSAVVFDELEEKQKDTLEVSTHALLRW